MTVKHNMELSARTVIAKMDNVIVNKGMLDGNVIPVPLDPMNSLTAKVNQVVVLTKNL